MDKSGTDLIAIQTERKRKERKKLCQQRYYYRKKGKLSSLIQDTEKARLDVNMLTEMRNSMYTRYYLPLSGQFAYKFSMAFAVVYREDESMQQRFIRSHFQETLAGKTASSAQAIIDYYIGVRTLFSSLWLNVVSRDVFVLDGEVSLTERREVRFGINRNTIAQLYPHLLTDEQFVQDLIGKEVVGHSCSELKFDKNQLVYSFEVYSDYTVGWMNLLQDPIKVAKVLDGSCRSITSSHFKVLTAETDTQLARQSSESIVTKENKSTLDYILDKPCT